MRKEIIKNFFKGKRVTVMGLGLLGRGIGDTAFLASYGAELVVTDKKSADELSSSIKSLADYPTIEFHLGEHRLSDFEDKDFILKAAGVPYDSEYVWHAKQRNIPVYMSAALVVDIIKKNFKNITVIGITGTRGKSTTTELIAHILRESGKRTHLGGNIRGLANLPLLEVLEEGDYLVLELDSWQLQGFGDLKISPDIAVFTSFLDDHMNYYKDDRELYFKDKSQLFINQDTPCLIASEQACFEIKKRLNSQEIIVPEVKVRNAHIIGVHNDVSMSLAIEAASRCGVPTSEAEKHILTFKPVEGRLQNVGVWRGVTVYNDNNATTPDAVIAGIEAVHAKHKKKPILIAGGADKGLPLEALSRIIQDKTKACVLLSGTGTDKLDVSKDNMFETVEDCIARAFELASPGDIILFSPGFASFSSFFKNEYERNDMFMKTLKTYK